MSPSVDVIIPHYSGSEKFHKCLESLFKTDYDNFRVVVIDNDCKDDSISSAKERFPDIVVLRLEENRGFAGGCNAGVNYSDREFIALLNDDTVVERDWLKYLVERISSDDNIAVVQPKLLWIKERNKFDYAGGMGGLMDMFGYPFCYGRIFETIETDEGQYDWVDDIFWASGTASLFRRKLFIEAGMLDEKFFAHQEEIDLNWRLRLMGYSIKAVSSAIVYHYAGATLPPESFMKKYFNHRNSILMVLKNLQLHNLLWILPIRILLEIAAMVLAVKQRDYRRIIAIIRGGLWIFLNFPHLCNQRRFINRKRVVPDREIFKFIYRGTVALQYYLFRKQTYYQLIPSSEKQNEH